MHRPLACAVFSRRYALRRRGAGCRIMSASDGEETPGSKVMALVALPVGRLDSARGPKASTVGPDPPAPASCPWCLHGENRGAAVRSVPNQWDSPRQAKGAWVSTVILDHEDPKGTKPRGCGGAIGGLGRQADRRHAVPKNSATRAIVIAVRLIAATSPADRASCRRPRSP